MTTQELVQELNKRPIERGIVYDIMKRYPIHSLKTIIKELEEERLKESIEIYKKAGIKVDK